MKKSGSLKFGKLTFYCHDAGINTKIKANQIANSLRNRGYKVRIIKYADGYAVYRRHKTL